nr:protein psiA-like [Misgurnus anguillicaudatus]
MLRSREDLAMKREDVDCCESSEYVTDDGSLDSVWMSRDQSRTPQTLLDSKLSEEKSRHTQDSDLSLTLLCYTESKLTDTQDTTVCDSKQSLQEDQTSTESLDSVCNAGEQQQILQTKLKMCSVKLIDCMNLMMKIKTEPTETKTEPTEMKTEPRETKTAPRETKTEPTETKTEPTETKTEPTETKTEPTETKTEPTETKTEPTETKTEPTEMKTDPTEMKTDPTEIKTEPTGIKTETTEEEDCNDEDDDFIPSGMSP